jgi:hypothetical protein
MVRAHYTMIWEPSPATMSSMKTVVIVATVAMGTLRIMWRALSPGSSASEEENTADE